MYNFFLNLLIIILILCCYYSIKNVRIYNKKKKQLLNCEKVPVNTLSVNTINNLDKLYKKNMSVFEYTNKLYNRYNNYIKIDINNLQNIENYNI